MFTDGRINVECPKFSEFTFLFSAIIKRVRAGFQPRDFGEFDFAFASPFVAFCTLEYVFDSFVVGDSSFDSGHKLVVSG